MYDHSHRPLEELLRLALATHLLTAYYRTSEETTLLADGCPVRLSNSQAHLFLCGMLCSTRPHAY